MDISVVGAGVGLGSTTALVGAGVGLMSTVAGASVGASVSTVVVVGRAVPTEIGQTPSWLGGSTLVCVKNEMKKANRPQLVVFSKKNDSIMYKVSV